MASDNNGSSFALGFALGGVIGAVVGILIAPRAGTETRADLAERSDVWRTRAEELAATLRERVTPAVGGVRERMGPAVETMRESVGPVVDQVSSRIGRRSRTDDIDIIQTDGAALSEDGQNEQPAEQT
jgi:gas vesicle protein